MTAPSGFGLDPGERALHARGTAQGDEDHDGEEH
jgi:hypothetical protein